MRIKILLQILVLAILAIVVLFVLAVRAHEVDKKFNDFDTSTQSLSF